MESSKDYGWSLNLRKKTELPIGAVAPATATMNVMNQRDVKEGDKLGKEIGGRHSDSTRGKCDNSPTQGRCRGSIYTSQSEHVLAFTDHYFPVKYP